MPLGKGKQVSSNNPKPKKARRQRAKALKKLTRTGLDGAIRTTGLGRVEVTSDYDTEWRSGFEGHSQFTLTSDYMISALARHLIAGTNGNWNYVRPLSLKIIFRDPVVGVFSGPKDKRNLIQVQNASTIGIYVLVDTSGYLDFVGSGKITDNVLRQVPGVRKLGARPVEWIVNFPKWFSGMQYTGLPPETGAKDLREWWKSITGTVTNVRLPKFVYVAMSDYISGDSVENKPSCFLNLKFVTTWECWGPNRPDTVRTVIRPQPCSSELPDFESLSLEDKDE